MCKEEKKDMLADAVPVKRKNIKKPVIRKSKFSNLSKSEWIETNNQSKQHRSATGITYKDIFGDNQ